MVGIMSSSQALCSRLKPHIFFCSLIKSNIVYFSLIQSIQIDGANYEMDGVKHEIDGVNHKIDGGNHVKQSITLQSTEVTQSFLVFLSHIVQSSHEGAVGMVFQWSFRPLVLFKSKQATKYKKVFQKGLKDYYSMMLLKNCTNNKSISVRLNSLKGALSW